MTASTHTGVLRHLTVVISVLFLAVTVVACDTPVEGGPVDMDDVEAHLDMLVGYILPGCDPAGLDGDGRGTIVGAGFECPDGTTFRIERFDAAVNDEPLTASPAETQPGRIEWRDGSSGDVIRVASNDVDIDVLQRVAESVEVRD